MNYKKNLKQKNESLYISIINCIRNLSFLKGMCYYLTLKDKEFNKACNIIDF